MEMHRVHKTSFHSHLGEEKHQMLDLNRRLESYLSRVKLLEEENGLLAEEITALRRSNHGASSRRKGLEEELQQARLELDTAWRDKIFTELDVGRLMEEVQALDQQRQREAQAHVKAKTMAEQSRKELEEEKRAQMWLREKVNQLEHEMKLLIHNHQEEVSHMEATLAHSRVTVTPMLAQRGKHQAPDLQQMGQEYSQRATRAWQETAEVYQGQLAQLEESLNQARSRMSQVSQEKNESQMRLRALEQEIVSAQEVRMHLEKTAAQQKNNHHQEIQQMQAHLEGLEVEREDLGKQIDHLVMENRGLLQLKMSLGLEVATYRALLDSESLRRDVSLSNPLRDASITDAALGPRSMKTSYRTQLLSTHKTTSVLPRSAQMGTAMPAPPKTTPLYSKTSIGFTDTPKTSRKPAEVTPVTPESPYPKILQDGAVENFRPQEVHEKVTYAEPLSPPNELEAPISSGDDEVDQDESPNKTPTLESAVSHHVVSDLSSEPQLTADEVIFRQFAAPSLTPYHVKMAENPCIFSDEPDKDVIFKSAAEEEYELEPHIPTEVQGTGERTGKQIEHEQDESSDSETEAVLEPTFESRTSSRASECDPGESVSNQLTDLSRDKNSSEDDADDGVVHARQGVGSEVGTAEADVEDKLLYPDGEEMDTWDSVMEKKGELKTEEGIKSDEAKTQHAEPEEDISAREAGGEKTEISLDDTIENNMAATAVDTQVNTDEQNENRPAADEKEDEDEDSQNVSVSWRTELESDSYAQDNTLADTRPLIRYKSDETDANTHMDESESSEGDQERRLSGELGSGTWSETKTKRFGTMEDLCEEGEAMDEEYDLGYTHVEERNADPIVAVGEGETSQIDAENAEAVIKEETEECSDEETEEFIQPWASAKINYSEMDTDRLVEQELEDLSTDSYSAHFGQRQVSERKETLQEKNEGVEMMMNEQEISEKTLAEHMFLCAEPGVRGFGEVASATTIIDQSHENQRVSNLTASANEEVQHEEQGDACSSEKREEANEYNVSVMEDVKQPLAFGDISPEFEEEGLPDSVQDMAASKDVTGAFACQQHQAEDDVVTHPIPEAPEWEPIKNLSEEHDDECRGSDEGVMMPEEEHSESSPDSVPGAKDIFVVTDSTKLLKTNGKDNNFSDFWASSLETGATYQPDDACNEQTNQNLKFNENLVWGNEGNPNIVNGNSLVAKKEPEVKSEVKQVLSRIVVDHSEESEGEGESWSSGEEPV